MNGWSEQNPQESADRTCARARAVKLGRMVKNVSGLFTDQNLERAAEVIVEQMNATMPVVVNGPQSVEDKKVVSSGQEVQFVPDNKARLEAAKFLTAMTEGLPVARQINIQADFQSLDQERKAMMLRSAAVQEAMLDAEQEAEILTENSQPDIR